jgi:hypothetical protein
MQELQQQQISNPYKERVENSQTDFKPNNESVSSIEKNNPFFSEEDIKCLLARLNDRHYKDRVERNNLLLDLIRAKQPISKYELAKISGISYQSIKRIIKEFQFCDLVVITLSTNQDTNMPVQLISIPKSQEKNSDG